MSKVDITNERKGYGKPSMRLDPSLFEYEDITLPSSSAPSPLQIMTPSPKRWRLTASNPTSSNSTSVVNLEEEESNSNSKLYAGHMLASGAFKAKSTTQRGIDRCARSENDCYKPGTERKRTHLRSMMNIGKLAWGCDVDILEDDDDGMGDFWVLENDKFPWELY